MKRIYSILVFLIFSAFILHSEIKFDPLSITKDNFYLFNSLESIGNNSIVKTLFYGKLAGETAGFSAESFYPENLYFFDKYDKFFIENRIGLYSYDLIRNSVTPVRYSPPSKSKHFSEHQIYNWKISSFSYKIKYSFL
jgi:hypothetical protein